MKSDRDAALAIVNEALRLYGADLAKRRIVAHHVEARLDLEPGLATDFLRAVAAIFTDAPKP